MSEIVAWQREHFGFSATEWLALSHKARNLAPGEIGLWRGRWTLNIMAHCDGSATLHDIGHLIGPSGCRNTAVNWRWYDNSFICHNEARVVCAGDFSEATARDLAGSIWNFIAHEVGLPGPLDSSDRTHFDFSIKGRDQVWMDLKTIQGTNEPATSGFETEELLTKILNSPGRVDEAILQLETRGALEGRQVIVRPHPALNRLESELEATSRKDA